MMSDRKCELCGKTFVPRPHWFYKLKGKYYCNYNCWRKAGGDSHKIYSKGDKK